MNLRPKFEYVKGALMNRKTTPSLEKCVQEVIQEEMRLQSQDSITEEPKVIIAPTSEDTALLSTNGQKVQCFECKGMGMWPTIAKRRNFALIASEASMSSLSVPGDLLERMSIFRHSQRHIKERLLFKFILILMPHNALLKL